MYNAAHDGLRAYKSFMWVDTYIRYMNHDGMNCMRVLKDTGQQLSFSKQRVHCA